MRNTFLVAWSLMLICAVMPFNVASAKPLNPADLPSDAKWVIHIDFDVLSDTEFASHIREQRPEMTRQIRHWMQEQYGINPQQDLHGLTMFSDTYESHSGAVIVNASFNRSKVESEFASKKDVQKSQTQNHTFYTWDVTKNLDSAIYGDLRRKLDQTPTTFTTDDRQTRERVSDRPDRSRGGSQDRKPVTAVLVDRQTIVFAPTMERAKAVVRLLDGETESLEGIESRLTAGIPQDAFCYGAAIELSKIKQHDGIFPILKQHDHIRWAIGESQGQMFEKVTLVAQDEQVASQMKNAVEGLVSLINVWAADAEHLSKLYQQNLSIRQDGQHLMIDWQGDSHDVFAALQEVRERMVQWKRAMN